MSQYLQKKIRERDGFEFVMEDVSQTVHSETPLSHSLLIVTLNVEVLTSSIIENWMISLSDYQYDHTAIILWVQYWENRQFFR